VKLPVEHESGGRHFDKPQVVLLSYPDIEKRYSRSLDKQCVSKKRVTGDRGGKVDLEFRSVNHQVPGSGTPQRSLRPVGRLAAKQPLGPLMPGPAVPSVKPIGHQVKAVAQHSFHRTSAHERKSQMVLVDDPVEMPMAPCAGAEMPVGTE
jgi:hypothetical protein